MTTREAAAVIGCDESHVRRMIRSGRLAAYVYQLPNGRVVYDIPPSEAARARSIRQKETRGRPRKNQP